MDLFTAMQHLTHPVASVLFQVMENATVGSANAMPVSLVTTVTAPQRRHPASQMMGRCAEGEETACAAAVCAQSRERLEIPVRNAQPAPMPAVPKGRRWFSFMKTDSF